jgi:hypothetical protein
MKASASKTGGPNIPASMVCRKYFFGEQGPRRPLSIQVRPIIADVDYRRIRTNSANWPHHGTVTLLGLSAVIPGGKRPL